MLKVMDTMTATEEARIAELTAAQEKAVKLFREIEARGLIRPRHYGKPG
jgi:hypothetical protein